MGFLVSYVIFLIVLTIPIVNIYQRAGLNAGLGFLTLIPVIGAFISIGILAFRDWPNEPAGYR